MYCLVFSLFVCKVLFLLLDLLPCAKHLIIIRKKIGMLAAFYRYFCINSCSNNKRILMRFVLALPSVSGITHNLAVFLSRKLSKGSEFIRKSASNPYLIHLTRCMMPRPELILDNIFSISFTAVSGRLGRLRRSVSLR